jgi:hypothetical protein
MPKINHKTIQNVGLRHHFQKSIRASQKKKKDISKNDDDRTKMSIGTRKRLNTVFDIY